MAARMRIATLALLGCGALFFGCSDEPVAALNRDAGAQSSSDAGGARDASASARDGGADARDGSVAMDAGTPIDQCDPLAQSGCNPPASKCVVEGPVAGTRCITPDDDDVDIDEVCMGRDCVAGLACVRESTTSTISRCVKVCDVENAVGCESLGADYDCTVRISGSNWGACQLLPPLCNPYDQTACDAEEACQPWLRRDGTFEMRCRDRGTGKAGDLCTTGNPRCDRGLACVRTTDGNAFCRQYCQTNTDCAPPDQCIGAVPSPPFMYCAE